MGLLPGRKIERNSCDYSRRTVFLDRYIVAGCHGLKNNNVVGKQIFVSTLPERGRKKKVERNSAGGGIPAIIYYFGYVACAERGATAISWVGTYTQIG